MKKYSEMENWAKIGLITGAILGFGVAIYMRHSGFLMGKLVGLGIMFAGYFIGAGVDRRISKKNSGWGEVLKTSLLTKEEKSPTTIGGDLKVVISIYQGRWKS